MCSSSVISPKSKNINSARELSNIHLLHSYLINSNILRLILIHFVLVNTNLSRQSSYNTNSPVRGRANKNDDGKNL